MPPEELRRWAGGPALVGAAHAGHGTRRRAPATHGRGSRVWAAGAGTANHGARTESWASSGERGAVTFTFLTSVVARRGFGIGVPHG